MFNAIFIQLVTGRQKLQVLEGCHSDEVERGHFGREKTSAKVAERYTTGLEWRTMLRNLSDLRYVAKGTRA